jgi:hypothetical protein
MRYRTNAGLLIEAETSLDTVRRLRDASWSEQGLSDQAYMEAVADRMYEQGIHVSTVSPDIFVAGLLIAGLLTREIEGAQSNETGQQIDN